MFRGHDITHINNYPIHLRSMWPITAQHALCLHVMRGTYIVGRSCNEINLPNTVQPCLNFINWKFHIVPGGNIFSLVAGADSQKPATCWDSLSFLFLSFSSSHFRSISNFYSTNSSTNLPWLFSKNTHCSLVDASIPFWIVSVT